MINLFYPYIPKEAGPAVGEVLKTRWIGQGPKVELFEKKFRELFKVENVVSVNSGTSALDTAYDLLDLKAGDEVISTPLTCTATNLPLIRRGVKIVWADILPETLCIDPLDVLNKVNDKTKAIVQVHLGGIKAEMSSIGVHLPVISDSAQALGIFAGDYTCNSFQAIKHITTGDGGMITCPSEKDAHKAKLLRWFGIDREKKISADWQAYKEREMTFDIELPGTKRHMNDISAVLGILGLEHYSEVIEYRAKLFNIYKDELYNANGVILVDGGINTHWLCTVLVDRREDFARKMHDAGIETNLVQVRNDIYKIFGGKRADLPVMNSLEDKYISLPLGMHVKEEDVEYICSTIKKGW